MMKINRDINLLSYFLMCLYSYSQQKQDTTNVDKRVDYAIRKTKKNNPLDKIEEYIKNPKHLLNIHSAETMEKEGVDLAEMNILLLQKVEELSLYKIELEKVLEESPNIITKHDKKLQELVGIEEWFAKLEYLIK